MLASKTATFIGQTWDQLLVGGRIVGEGILGGGLEVPPGLSLNVLFLGDLPPPPHTQKEGSF